ncbi:MAG: tetratricopeptide repeat protein [Candidatus Brocadia sp.]|nr:tetratricopeptide repeat protein [Candidatus Brocadia sp.]
MGAAVVALSIASVYRNGTWRDEFTLWYSTVNREPDSVRAHQNLGVVHSARGFFDYAEFEYKKTLEINPRDAEAHYNMGNAYERKGMSDAAIKEYQEALREYKTAIGLDPGNADVHNNLAGIYLTKEVTDRAIAELKSALKYDSKDSNARCNLGNAYIAKGFWDQAISVHRIF